MFGKNVEDVEIDKWWTGGLTLAGMEELEGRQRSLRNYKSQIRYNKGEYRFEE